jgi:hypothetical protein
MGKAEVVAPASFFDTFLFLIDFVVKSNFHRISELAVQIFMETKLPSPNTDWASWIIIDFHWHIWPDKFLAKNFFELISGRALKPQPIHVSSA